MDIFRRTDLVTAREMFQEMQYRRREIARSTLVPDMNLHSGFLRLGYEEREPIVCEYGEGYKRPEEQLVQSAGREKKRDLTILIPAEFVPGSRAAVVLDGTDSSRREIYAVYSQ